MMLAQRLYEAGNITYMRTDSTNLSIDAIMTCRKFIFDQYGKSTYHRILFSMPVKKELRKPMRRFDPPMFTNGVLKFQ